MNGKELLFCCLHPIQAVKVMGRQLGVSLGISGPPVRFTIEDFPKMPIDKASRALTKDKKVSVGGVCLCDWSSRDQLLLVRGEKPKSYPVHNNV